MHQIAASAGFYADLNIVFLAKHVGGRKVMMLGSIALLVVILFAVAIDANLDALAGQLDEFIGQGFVGEAVHGNIHREPRALQAVEVKVLQVFGRGKMVFRDNLSGLGIFNRGRAEMAEMKVAAEMEQHGQSGQHQNDWKPATKTAQQEVQLIVIHQIYVSPIPDEEKCSQ